MPTRLKQILFGLGFFTQVLIAKPALADLRCEDLFPDGKATKLDPKILEHHDYVDAQGFKFRVLATTSTIVNYVRNGGAPKSGLFPFWSSEAVLKSVFSLYGPLGPFGPLSPEIGVLRNDPTSSYYWGAKWSNAMSPFMSWFQAWRDFSPMFSKFGPLGWFGPLFGNFHEGIFAVLGTAGSLQLPLNAGGPLNPNKLAAGIKGPNADGEYLSAATGEIVNEFDVRPLFGKERKERIFRLLSRSYANKLSRNRSRRLDTSFAFNDWIAANRQRKVFYIKSPDDQPVFFQTVSTIQGTNAALVRKNSKIEFRDFEGNLVFESDAADLISGLWFEVKKGAEFQIVVSRYDDDDRSEALPFRLIANGTPSFNPGTQGVYDNPGALAMPSSHGPGWKE